MTLLSGHQLEFHDAQLGCITGLQRCNVVMTTTRMTDRPWLERWPVSLHLAHTKRVSAAALPCSGQPACSGIGTLALLAMTATAVSKSVQTDHVNVIAHCATNLVQSSLHVLSLHYSGLYLYSPVQSRASQEMHQNENRIIIAAEPGRHVQPMAKSKEDGT